MRPGGTHLRDAAVRPLNTQRDSTRQIAHHPRILSREVMKNRQAQSLTRRTLLVAMRVSQSFEDQSNPSRKMPMSGVVAG